MQGCNLRTALRRALSPYRDADGVGVSIRFFGREALYARGSGIPTFSIRMDESAESFMAIEDLLTRKLVTSAKQLHYLDDPAMDTCVAVVSFSGKLLEKSRISFTVYRYSNVRRTYLKVARILERVFVCQ